MEPSSLDAAEVLGAEICELEASWDIDGGGELPTACCS